MASRSPTIHHSFWGPFANAAALPLGDPRLETGDTAYAQAEASLYVYDGAAWQPVGGGGGGAVFAGALTVYVDPVNGTDAPGGGTLGSPYASINYAYSQVTSLGNPSNTVYNANVGQFVTEKLIFQLAPGRYNENVLLGFKRGRVQLVGNGVQILGSVTMRAVRADFPAANMEALRASFPAPWTGASAQMTFEITGQAGGGVEADTTADPFVVTGLSMLLFDEPTVPGTISSGLAWENNYGQFNFYANKAYLIGGMVYSTSYVTTPTRGLCTSVLEIDSCTIGESAIPYRSYLGAVPYAYAANPTLWNNGTGVATGAQTSTTLQDTTKAWVVNAYAGATVVITSGTGVGQTRTVLSNTATALTVSAWTTTPVAGSSVYTLVGTTNKVAEGTLTAKVHNSTLGAALGPRLVLGELDGCRIYDVDYAMLGTVDNGGVTGSISSSYIGSVINQFRQYSGTGIPASQYRLGSVSSGTRLKIDSTSYTTLAFNRSSSTGALTARTLTFPSDSGTATAGAATTLTDSSKAWVTNRWAGGTVTLTGGTGSGQTRTISSNTATAITVSPAWTTNPAAGTTYTVTALVAFDFQDDARSLAYTPTTPASWLDPDPATVGSALDKVAALGLLAAAPTNGQIPIGNGTNFTPATLTAGAGISVTNGAGTVTIAATGGSLAPDRTYYVTEGGSDVTGNGSILAPFASINAAITAIGAPAVPYTVAVGPGTFGSGATPISVPANVTIEGSTNTSIDASSLTLNNSTSVLNATLNTSNVTVNSGSTAFVQNVTLIAPATTITNSSSTSTLYTTNVTAQGSVTYSGGNIIQQSNRYESALIVNNATSYSAVANSSLSISIGNSTATISASTSGSLTSTNSSTTVASSSIPGNVTATGGSLTVGGSSIGGTVTGAGGAAIALSLDSYPQGGATIGGGSTLTNTTKVAQNVALDATATLSTPATIGTVYVPQPTTLTVASVAYIGGSVVSDVTSLELVPAGGGPAVATWTRTGLLGNQALASPAAIASAGWYDLVLTPGASGTAFARGLYLV